MFSKYRKNTGGTPVSRFRKLKMFARHGHTCLHLFVVNVYTVQ